MRKYFVTCLFFLFSISQSYCQISSLSDIENINSLESFTRVMVENYFQARYDDYQYKQDNHYTFDLNDNIYGYGMVEGKINGKYSKIAKMWAKYDYNNTGQWYIDIDVPEYFRKIFEEIKQKCEFEMVWGSQPCYKCPNATYDGMLCVQAEGSGGIIAMQKGLGYSFGRTNHMDYFEYINKIQK